MLELELLELVGFGILPIFLTLMNLPSKSNQKDEPIEIAIALITQPSKVNGVEETLFLILSKMLMLMLLPFSSFSPSQPIGKDIFSEAFFSC